MPKLMPLVLALVALGSWARADEGMWTYNNFPKDVVKKRYGVDVSDAWLDHVRLSSVRFNSGGSGSFVSERGLVMTNHHVGADCIHKLAAADKDYIKNGFYARSAAEEAKCPDLELNVLTGIEDVTAAVKGVEKAGMDDAAINKAQKEKMAQIEKECADKTKQRCDVVTLYQGGMYNLYRYKKYTDVRLVFAPEFQIAFFGGDPDNFEYPRYDLDVAYFRVYENGAELHPEHYLKWSQKGAKDNEPVFVSGNPGRTERLDTLAMIEFLRDVQYPTRLKSLGAVIKALRVYGGKGSEEARQAERVLFGSSNAFKATTGYRGGMLDKTLMAKKAAEEAQLKKTIAAAPDKQAQYGKIWDNIAAAENTYRGFYKRFANTEEARFGELFSFARQLVRLTEEKTKPSEKRLREYRDSNLASLELRLFSTAPIYDGVEETLFTVGLEQAVDALGTDDATVKTLLAGKSPAERAHELISTTKLKDVALRKQLAASKAAVQASTDPLIVLARTLDPEARATRKRYEDDVEGPVKKNLGLLAKAQFDAKGLSQYPDATFTLRLSFGKVAGYKVKGKKIPPMTNIAGLYARAARAANKMPWEIPPKWAAAKAKVNGKVPFDFVSSNDIIGGNSGSPVVNAAGEVVGLIFDGNIESLPGAFIYDESVNRAVSVHSSALIEALRSVYDAGALADEMQPAMGREHATR